MQLSQEQVTRLLGHRSRNLLSRLEMGYSVPRLYTAMQLAIIYRVPVDFLYQKQYVAMREQIRDRESRIFAKRELAEGREQ